MKIISMIPADGWCGVYLLTEPPWYWVSALACWALVEFEDCDEERCIVGMDAVDTVEGAENADNFYCYVFRSEMTDHISEGWVKTAQNKVLKVKSKKPSELEM